MTELKQQEREHKQHPKIIDFYGRKHVQLHCALCATVGKITNILIDEYAYSINRYGTACSKCMSSELNKERQCRSKCDPTWRYQSQYLPPKKLCTMNWDELCSQDKEETERIQIQEQELVELNERNMSVALGFPNTDEHRLEECRVKLFTNKGPWKRETTGQILEPEEPEEPEQPEEPEEPTIDTTTNSYDNI